MKASKDFAAKFAEAQRRLGLSDEELAHRLGVSAYTVWRWRHGKNFPRSRAIRERIREVLGIEVEVGD